MRLQDRFKKLFILPLIIGITISLAVTAYFLVEVTKFYDNENLLKVLNVVEIDMNIPLIETTKLIIYRKFQKPLDDIDLIKKYFYYYANIVNSSIEFENINNSSDLKNGSYYSNLINDFSYNSLFLSRNDKTNFKLLNNSKSDLQDYSEWGVNNQVSDLKNLSILYPNDLKLQQLFVKQLSVLTSMTQVLRSLYNTMVSPKQQFFTGSIKTKLFFAYPLDENGFIGKFENFLNPSTCKNSSNVIATYYNFECRPFFLQIIEYLASHNDSSYITYPYKFAQTNKVGLSVCNKFNDSLDFDSTSNNYFVFCQDINLTDIMLIFDHLKLLSSIDNLFVLRVDSNMPIYYPNIINTNFSDLKRLIFNIETENEDDAFYLDDFESFTEVEKKMIMRDDNYNESTSGNYTKLNSLITYYKYPLRFKLDDTNNKNAHLLSIIITSKTDNLKSDLKKIFLSLYIKIVIQFTLLFVFGIILLLIAFYLITSIAKNIIKPIKNLKTFIKGMNVKSNDLVENFTDTNTENQDNDEEEEEEEKDEETFDVRSKEIEKLFNLLIKVKKVVSFTSNKNDCNEQDVLLKFLESKYFFKRDFNNKKGENMCDSNVGNLSIKLKKYDKAIFHLSDSILLIRSKEKISNEDLIYNKNKMKSHRLTSRTSIFQNVNIPNKNMRKTISELKPFVHQSFKNSKDRVILLESRFPKLIFAYKKFFKIIKKISKEKEIYDEIVKGDFFAIKGIHDLEHYERIVREYLYESIKTSNESKIAEGIIELNTFLIDFILIPNLEDSEKLKETFEFIIKNFNELDVILKNLKYMFTPDYLKHYLHLITSNNSENLEIIETPISVLFQRNNYLKGKLALYSGHYSEAIKYFFCSREVKYISDARIIKRSNLKIKKIMTYFFNLLDEKTKNEILQKKQSENYLNMKDKILDYIEFLNDNLSNHSYQSKDLIVLIDVSKSMTSYGSKKIIQACRSTKNIFFSYITSEDRFGLFTFNKFVNSIVTLSHKNTDTINYIEDSIHNLAQKTVSIIEESSLPNAINKISKYLKKKSNDLFYIGSAKKEKWIIIFTDKTDSSLENENLIKKKQLNLDLFNIIIISMENSKKYMEKIISIINFNKSEVIDFENFEKLRKILKITGIIREDDLNLNNEKYKSEKKIV